VPPRVAYTVGRQVGNAVERNRLRRRLRAVVAAHEAELQRGGAYLLGAERRAMTLDHTSVDTAVSELLRAVRGVSS
jgi:ribonuclease P protein component